MLKKTLKYSVLALSTAITLNAYADTGFKVPVHYNLELVDGVSDPSNYSRFSRMVTLTPGKHQVVVTFKDTFKGSSGDARMVQSLDPIVIDIENIKNDEVITFDYAKPLNEKQADSYAHKQKINLINNTGKALSSSEASYFILTSDKGFSLLRDYRQELQSVNRLYAPSYTLNQNNGLQMTENGAPTIKATDSGYQQTEQQGLALQPMGSTDTSAMSTTKTAGGAASAADYNNLVKLYNQADDATKLKFVKYVMSH